MNLNLNHPAVKVWAASRVETLSSKEGNTNSRAACTWSSIRLRKYWIPISMRAGIKILQICKTRAYMQTKTIVIKVKFSINTWKVESVLSSLRKSNHSWVFITKEVFKLRLNCNKTLQLSIRVTQKIRD